MTESKPYHRMLSFWDVLTQGSAMELDVKSMFQDIKNNHPVSIFMKEMHSKLKGYTHTLLPWPNPLITAILFKWTECLI